jgi:hypothetical protein
MASLQHPMHGVLPFLVFSRVKSTLKTVQQCLGVAVDLTKKLWMSSDLNSASSPDLPHSRPGEVSTY